MMPLLIWEEGEDDPLPITKIRLVRGLGGIDIHTQKVFSSVVAAILLRILEYFTLTFTVFLTHITIRKKNKKNIKLFPI